MRAAAFSYGVLETLRDMEIITPSGRWVRALDEVDVITGVSGGSRLVYEGFRRIIVAHDELR